MRTHMKYKGTLIVVKDCNRALKFYRDMFGFQLLQDNDGNMELTNHLYLQESGYWEQFTKRSVIPNSNQSDLLYAWEYGKTNNRMVFVYPLSITKSPALEKKQERGKRE